MDALPECALTCLLTALSNSTCTLTDFACICADEALNAQLQPCLLSSCTVKESLTAQNFSYTTCDYPAPENTITFPIVNIVGIVVAILSVALRVTNRVLVGQVGLDDYAIVLSLAVAIAISGVGFPLKSHGLGKNIWTVPFPDIDETLKLFFIEETLYTLCTALVKGSLLLLYLRLFPNPLLRISIFISLALTLSWGLGSLIAQVVSCKPISFYWKQWDGEHEGQCVDHNSLLLAHAIINIALDVLVIVLPMPVLVNLQMGVEKRVGMCFMFGVGLVVTVISILRLVETVGFNSTTNPTKDFVPVGVYSLIELDVGIMCACMPGIRALCKKIYSVLFKKPTGYSYGSDRRKPNGSGGSGSGSGSARPSPQQFVTKSSQGTASGHEHDGQFIRLEEVESQDSRWPLRDPESVYRTDSYWSAGGPTRLNPTGLGPTREQQQYLFVKKPGAPRSNSAYFTWFRDGDSS